MNKIDFNRRRDLPNIAACYAIFNAEECLYVGSTILLKNRISHHNRKQEFVDKNACSIEWFPVDDTNLLLDLEIKKIKQLKPSLNSVAVLGKGTGISKKFICITTSLKDVTLALLHSRSATIKFETISTETGIPLPWLRTFNTDKCADPGVNRVQTLYEYLTKTKLQLESLPFNDAEATRRNIKLKEKHLTGQEITP